MTIHATFNPIGSTSPKDLIDNAQNLDYLILGPALLYPDRRSVNRLSWAGIEAAFADAQARRADDYAASEENRGYENPVPYADGIDITRVTQLVQYNAELYKAKAGTLPWTTTGVWATDSAKLVSVGDAALRQDVANAADPAKGAAGIGRGVQIVNSVTELRALLKSSPSKNAFVSGYSAAGDGGGPGWVYLDSLDTTSPDNGQTLFVAADGGRWKQVNNNYPALPNTSTAYNITNMGFRLKFAAANILKNSSFYVWHDTGIAPMGTNLAENTNRMVCAQWRMETVGAGTTISAIQRVTAVEGGLRFTVAFGPSLGYAYVRQNVLGVRQFSGKTLTATVDIEVSAACQLDFYARLRFNALNDEANRPLVVGTSLISLAAGRHTVAVSMVCPDITANTATISEQNSLEYAFRLAGTSTTVTARVYGATITPGRELCAPGSQDPLRDVSDAESQYESGQATNIGWVNTSGQRRIYAPFRAKKYRAPALTIADAVGNVGAVSTYDIAGVRTDNVTLITPSVSQDGVTVILGAAPNPTTVAGVTFQYVANCYY